MNKDERYMQMAIDLAKKAEGRTNPNPLVGAVIVKSGRVIGKGYHKKAGDAHAEINALQQAYPKAAGGTLYVTLEPCDHFGRTPPCTDAIINSGITKVAISMKDPNPINNGRGIRTLRRHGIDVRTGILAEEARSMNTPYIKFITKKMPYVTVKVGQSLDGKIATRSGDSRWITSEDSRRYVHALRSTVDAVMVGANTALKDDPMLTSRLPGSKARQPMRIVVDEALSLPLNAKIFSNVYRSPVLIATSRREPAARIASYEKRGARVLVVKSKKGLVDLKELFAILGAEGVMHLLVEGGGELIASVMEEGLADRLLFFIAPKVIGGRSAKTSVEGDGVEKVADALPLQNVRIRKFGKDILIEADIRCSPA